MEAALTLQEEGIDAWVIDIHTLKPLDEEIIIKAARETGKIITAEEHSVIGGLGSAVASVLSGECPTLIKMIGQNDTFGESGPPQELKVKYGMTADAIVSMAKSIY